MVAENATKRAKAQTGSQPRASSPLSRSAERDKRLDRSLLLAVEAFEAGNTFEARESLYQALQDQPGLTSFLHIDEGRCQSVAFSPDGKTIAAGYGDVGRRRRRGAVGRGRAQTPGRRATRREGGQRWSVAFSPDGKTIAAGYASRSVGGGGVVLWDVAARKRLVDEPLPVKEGDVKSVAFSPDGKTIAAGYAHRSGGGGVVLWDVAARKRLVDEPLPVKEGASRAWPSAPTARPSRPDTARRPAAAWCCGTWPHANAWSTSHSP